jgi:hypothetical protein
MADKGRFPVEQSMKTVLFFTEQEVLWSPLDPLWNQLI